MSAKGFVFWNLLLCLLMDLWLSGAQLTWLCSSPAMDCFWVIGWCLPCSDTNWRLSRTLTQRACQRAKLALSRSKLAQLEEREHDWCVCSTTSSAQEMLSEGRGKQAVLDLSLANCAHLPREQQLYWAVTSFTPPDNCTFRSQVLSSLAWSWLVLAARAPWPLSG